MILWLTLSDLFNVDYLNDQASSSTVNKSATSSSVANNLLADLDDALNDDEVPPETSQLIDTMTPATANLVENGNNLDDNNEQLSPETSLLIENDTPATNLVDLGKKLDDDNDQLPPETRQLIDNYTPTAANLVDYGKKLDADNDQFASVANPFNYIRCSSQNEPLQALIR